MAVTTWGQHRADDRDAFGRLARFSNTLKTDFPKAQLVEDLERIRGLCDDVEKELNELKE